MIFFYYRFFDFDMVKSHDLRDITISHYKNGKKAPQISKLLANKVHRNTIDRWLHRYKQSGSIYAKRKPGRPKTGRTKQCISYVKKRLDSNIPRKSLRTMAKDFGSNRRTIKLILNLDLNKKYYRKISVQGLKEDQKAARKRWCQWIRKNIDRSKVERLMFTDEKIFTRNGFLNPKK